MADNTLEIKIVADASQASAVVKDQARAVNALTQQVEISQISFKKLAAAVASGQAALAGLSGAVRGVFVNLPRAALDAAVKFESLEAAMRAVFGTAEAAQREMAQLRAESERLGLPLETLSRQWLGFAAAARGTALEGEAAREAFIAIAEAATVLGLSQDQLAGALNAVQQMISKGAVSSEELRQQLGERLYGAVQVAARSIGLTSEAFNELLERGMVPVTRFLPAFAAQLRTEFGGAAAEAANTARAAFARLENALGDLKLEFARSGFMDAIVDAARQLTEAFKDEQFRQSVREFGALIGTLTRLIIEHGDKLVILGGVIAGARTGGAVGRLGGPQGALAGAAIGGIAGGLGAASLLPEETANGQDAKRVHDVAAAVERLKRRIEETRRAAAAGLVKPDEAAARIREDEARIATLTAQKPSVQPSGDAKLGPQLQWDALVERYRSANDKLAQEIEKARAIGKALGKPAAEIEAMIARIRGTEKRGASPRLPRLVETFDAELTAMRAALKTAEEVLEASFHARLVKEEDYWRAKGEMQRRALDLEADDLRRQMADQERIIHRKGETPENIERAKNKLAELKIKLDEIDGRRMTVDLEIKTNIDRVRQELEDLKAGLREKIAEATGTMTPEMRRAAIERSYRDMLAKMGDDAEGQALIRRAIDVEAAKAEMASLESAWRLALETMRNAETSANIQREQGLITTAEAQAKIAEAHRQAATELDALLPKLEAVAGALGPEAAARVAAWKNELASVKTVVDPLAASLDTSIKNAFEDMFLSIGQGAKTAKDAFLDFARSVLGAIQRILAQRLAEQLFGSIGKGGSIGGAILSFFGLKFASGGHVPGTGNRDTVPALLTPGEYVIRKDAVRRFGIGLLDAINGLRIPPAVVSGRLAFAAGGLVPAVAPQSQAAPQQNIRIVNAVDPELARDWIESPAGERVILNVLTRNAGAVRTIMGN